MNSLRPTVLVLIGVLAGVGGTVAVTAVFRPPPPPAVQVASVRQLDSNLFMQVSAEYRACCLQAFSLARERVAAKLKDRTDKKPPAVVLDLDETVLDNGAFQARQIRTGVPYQQSQWEEFEKSGGEQVRLVPGAKDFLDWLKKQKVEAVYITNRSETHRAELHAVLKRLDLDVPDEQLLLFKDDKSDKTERRAKAAEAFDVLLLVGDNLRDFDNVFKHDGKTGADGRKAAVDERRAKFGTEWIILPNPAYGEWTKGLPGGMADAELLK